MGKREREREKEKPKTSVSVKLTRKNMLGQENLGLF